MWLFCNIYGWQNELLAVYYKHWNTTLRSDKMVDKLSEVMTAIVVAFFAGVFILPAFA